MKVRVNAFTMSLDGFGAGPNQSESAPMGTGTEGLHRWLFNTRTFQKMVMGKADGPTGVDEDFAAASFENVGAWIMGRNMFGPVRGPWPDESWRGWWGESPPYHVPVFVLTHHARAPLKMDDTIFHFVTDGYESALAQAKAAAGSRDVRIGGGAATIRQYVSAGAIDEIHFAISPVLIGRGEPLFSGIDLPSLGFRVARSVAGDAATHVVLAKS
ncbi:MAG: dihydrofolate reductase family protein [Kofleriaceae bacterium]